MVENLAADGVNWNLEKVQPCTYVNGGEKVVACIDDKPRLVTVAVAAGYHARVRTEDGQECWRNVTDLARLRAAPAAGDEGGEGA